MIIVLKPNTSEENVTRVENQIKAKGLDTHIVRGTGLTIIGCIGDTTLIDPRLFEVDSCVDKVMHVQEPLQTCQPCFPPGGFHRGCLRRKDWRRSHGSHRRTLLCGDIRAGVKRSQSCESLRCEPSSGRRFQAPHQPLFFPGTGIKRSGNPLCSERRGGTPHRHRAHVPGISGYLQREGRFNPDWRQKYAEL